MRPYKSLSLEAATCTVYGNMSQIDQGPRRAGFGETFIGLIRNNKQGKGHRFSMAI